MKDQRHLLKIKIKSLAAEARIIRREEAKRKIPHMMPSGDALDLMMAAGNSSDRARWLRGWRRSQRAAFRGKSWFGESQKQLEQMHIHRTLHLREITRASHLAYGFIRGRTLLQLEATRHPLDPATRERISLEAERMVVKYGPKSIGKGPFQEWMERKDLALKDDGGGWPLLVPAPSAHLSLAKDVDEVIGSLAKSALKDRGDNASGLLDAPSDDVSAKT